MKHPKYQQENMTKQELEDFELKRYFIDFRYIDRQVDR